MKGFIINEAGKAIQRLKGTIVFALKAIFIVLVNIIFWLFPLFLMGYLVLQPVASGVRKFVYGSQTYSQTGGSPPAGNYPAREKQRTSLINNLRSAESFLRELRFLKQS